MESITIAKLVANAGAWAWSEYGRYIVDSFITFHQEKIKDIQAKINEAEREIIDKEDKKSVQFLIAQYESERKSLLQLIANY